MLIWHKRYKDGNYYMRTNMLLVQDMNHLLNILSPQNPGITILDMASVPGNQGLWRLVTKDNEILGEAYDPDIYRVFPGDAKEMVVPAYQAFYDNEGKFSKELFKLNYRVQNG